MFNSKEYKFNFNIIVDTFPQINQNFKKNYQPVISEISTKTQNV